jgi:predicted ABC-type transport system involved in lysophospholipase L1 biosynthesis ATPase subunit
MTLLAICEVSKSYRDGMRDRLVLDRVSLQIGAGEKVGVLAAGRAGKTTLLKIAAGLESPDSGSVRWKSHDLTRLSANKRAVFLRREGMALVSCVQRPVVALPVAQYVARPLYSDGLKFGEAERCAHRALEWVEAPHLGYRMTDQLGMSEQVRVELARALIREPRLLLVDEPAVLPRPSDARKFYELLHGLPRRFNLAMLIASEEAMALRGAQRVMNLDRRLYSSRKTMEPTDDDHNVVELRARRGPRLDAL